MIDRFDLARPILGRLPPEAAHAFTIRALALGLAGRTTEAAQVARADLDERSVQSNLAYYAVLRAMSPKERTDALLRPAAQARPQSPAAATH